MKMKTRIISLSILAILTVCLLNVAAVSAATPQPAPKLVGDTLLIHETQSSIYVGQTVYFSGYLTNYYGNGMNGWYGTLYSNGQPMWTFYTYSGGSWGPLGITFNAPGTYYVSAYCDGISAGVYVQVY